jgi:hypothetical protein
MEKGLPRFRGIRLYSEAGKFTIQEARMPLKPDKAAVKRGREA